MSGVVTAVSSSSTHTMSNSAWVVAVSISSIVDGHRARAASLQHVHDPADHAAIVRPLQGMAIYGARAILKPCVG
jgi:hypothetical protein